MEAAMWMVWMMGAMAADGVETTPPALVAVVSDVEVNADKLLKSLRTTIGRPNAEWTSAVDVGKALDLTGERATQCVVTLSDAQVGALVEARGEATEFYVAATDTKAKSVPVWTFAADDKQLVRVVGARTPKCDASE
jgi:hypothetical protein